LESERTLTKTPAGSPVMVHSKLVDVSVSVDVLVMVVVNVEVDTWLDVVVEV
jgi:hypothetical protein